MRPDRIDIDELLAYAEIRANKYKYIQVRMYVNGRGDKGVVFIDVLENKKIYSGFWDTMYEYKKSIRVQLERIVR